MLVAVGAQLKASTSISKLEIVPLQRLYAFHNHRAVELLTSVRSPPPVEVALILSLLLLITENFQGSDYNAIVHVEGGMSILRGWIAMHVQSRGPQAAFVRDEIVPFFKLLEAEKMAHVEERLADMSINDAVSAHSSPHVDISVGGSTSLEEARDELLPIIDRVFAPNTESEMTRTTEAESTEMLKAWRRSTDKLVRKRPDISNNPASRKTLQSLEIHHDLLTIVSQSHSSPLETAHDAHQAAYSALISSLHTLITARDSIPLTTFPTSDLGLIPPLLHIALHCRHPVTRRRATYLLRYLHRYEGAWDTCCAAKIAERVVEIEERGLSVVNAPADVSEFSRVRLVRAELRRGRSGQWLSAMCARLLMRRRAARRRRRWWMSRGGI